MISFVDLNTGNVFNGGFPYEFWFDNAQSIDLIYTKPICFISEKSTTDIEISSNPIFKLLKLQDNIDEFKSEIFSNISYKDIQDLYSNGKLKTRGYKYDNVYIHIFYISCSADLEGQYREEFKIDGEEFVIGADFYQSEESYKINLSNNGIEIPNAIQKAIYSSNIHEDKTDNILMNRKWKELLSNYWDILANKGSYKSLYNSLKWFEYGDELKLYEIWKSGVECKLPFEERDIKEVLSNKYFETLNGFSKTTYFAISCALSKIVKGYDEEKNPILERIVRNWSVEDLSLKLSLLGSFFKTYFMPIHTDCIRATIEDIVYTNTFKTIAGSCSSRHDIINNTYEFDCNIKTGDVFPLNIVEVRVGKDTLFGVQFEEFNNINFQTNYDNIDIIGVQFEEPEFNVKNNISNDNIKTYLSQRYNGIGAVIEFRVSIPLQSKDFVKMEKLSVFGDVNEEWHTITNHKLYDCVKTDKGYVINIPFNILCTKEKHYDIRLEFETASGKIFTKRLEFDVIDTGNSSIKVYKIVHNKKLDINDIEFPNDFIYGGMNRGRNYNDKKRYIQYIPAIKKSPYIEKYKDYKGVCLNHFLVIKVDNFNDVLEDSYIKDNYFIWTKDSTPQKYVLCMSKVFGFEPDYAKIYKYRKLDGSGIYKNEYIYYPPFHHKEELTGDDLKDFTITNDDALCIIPEIPFSKYIEDARWEFINRSTLDNKTIIPPYDVKEPYIIDYNQNFLEPGYYDIVFRYKLRNGQKYNTLVLKSAFLKK